MRDIVFFVMFLLSVALVTNHREIGAFMTKHRKLVRAVAIIVGVAVYLNIGWAIGTYYHNYIFGHTPQTFWQTVWKGGYPAIINTVYDSPLYDQILSMFAWPLLGLISVLLWVVRFAQIGTIYFVWLVSYIFKLIFAGGIAKLLGIG